MRAPSLRRQKTVKVNGEKTTFVARRVTAQANFVGFRVKVKGTGKDYFFSQLTPAEAIAMAREKYERESRSEVKEMSREEILRTLALCRQEAHTEPHYNEGTRVHIIYRAFEGQSEKAKRESQPARDMGLPREHYTGRLIRVWESGNGDLMVTIIVELERYSEDPERKPYRSFNLDKGHMLRIDRLGETRPSKES